MPAEELDNLSHMQMSDDIVKPNKYEKCYAFFEVFVI